MTITVEGPNGVVIDFPDGTTPATINSVMAQATGQGAPASQGALSNSGDDGWISGAAKGAATGVVKGLANSIGTVGNLKQFGDYLGDRLESAISGKSMDDIAARNRKVDEARSANMLSRLTDAVNPGTVLPSGEQVARPILNQTGEYKPESMPGRMAQAAVETAAGMVGPGGGARAPGSTLKEALMTTPARMAPANMVAGAAGQGVTEVTDDPLLGMAAGMAVPAAGSAALAAGKRGTRFATENGRNQLVGERLLREAENPEKVRADLQFQPSEQVPGSKLTTAQVTEDMGLLQAERRARTEAANGPDAGNTPFNIRDAEQNAARQDMLDQARGQGNPLKVSYTFQQHLDNIDKSTQATIDQWQQAAQQQASKLGPGVAPEVAGQQLRDAVLEQMNTARQQRRALYDAVDPDGSMRLVTAPVRNAAEAIAQTEPKFGSGIGPEVKTVVEQAQRMPEVMSFSDLRQLDEALSAAMSAERRTKGETPDWQKLAQLKGSVKDAINNAVDHKVSWEREQVQRGVMDVGNTIEARIADTFGPILRNSEADGSAARKVPGASTAGNVGLAGAAGHGGQGYGNRPLVPGVSAAEGRRAPQSLTDWIAANGGIQDIGGDLAARGYPKWSPKGRRGGQGIVNNETGMTPDDARLYAAEAGYLGGHIDDAMANTTINDLLNALDNGHQTYSVHDEGQLANHQSFMEARAARSADLRAREEFRAGLQEQGIPHPGKAVEERAVRLMNEEGMPWENALERVQIDAYNRETDAALNRSDRLANAQPEFDTFPGDLPSGSQAAPVEPPNMDQAAGQRLAAANKFHGNFARTYREGPIAPVLKTNGYADNFRIPDAGVMKRAWKPGDEGYATVQSFLKAANNAKEAVSAIRDYALNDLRSAVGPDGTLDPKAFERWKGRYAQALRGVDEVSPGFSRRFDSAAHATEQMISAGARRKQAIDAFRKSEAAKFLGKTDPGEVASQIGTIIKDVKGGPTRMQEIVRQASKSPEALEGLRSGAVDWIVGQVLNAGEVGTSGRRPLSNAKLQKILDDHAKTLSIVLPPDTMANIKAVAADLAMSNLKITATGNAGSPNTAKDLISERASKAHANHPSLLAAMLAGAASGWHFGSVALGATTGGSFYILGKLRAAGLDRADAMFRDALLNPERAKFYLSKVQEKSTSAAWKRLARSIQRQLLLMPIVQKAEERDYARGGAVVTASARQDFMQQINSALKQRMMASVSRPSMGALQTAARTA